ncbi:hypothetical protein [Streptomyces sp. bgisy153]|uniref:hypothetical protein n=1 Tax=Streptomyces sp. bgisy153 TaxID=3413793 RepID=UPI003D72988E
MTRTPRTSRTDCVPAAVDLTRGAGRRAAEGSDHPLIGLAGANRPVRLTPDDGHVLLVAPDGMGTSSLLRTLGAQALASGHHLDILDVHLDEHAWARGLERVTYIDEPDAVHWHLIGLAHQARRRAAAAAPGPRRLLLVESCATTDVLLNHHADLRPNGAPIDALTAVLAHGRPAGMQVVMACTALPPPLRHIAADLFTTRLLIDPDECTWRAVRGAPGDCPPANDPRPGLWHHLSAAGTTTLRAARVSGEDAAALARRLPTSRTRRRRGARTTKESD